MFCLRIETKKLAEFICFLFCRISRTKAAVQTKFVISQLLIFVNIKNTVFWDVTSCSLAERYQHFGEICFEVDDFHSEYGSARSPEYICFEFKI